MHWAQKVGLTHRREITDSFLSLNHREQPGVGSRMGSGWRYIRTASHSWPVSTKNANLHVETWHYRLDVQLKIMKLDLLSTVVTIIIRCSLASVPAPIPANLHVLNQIFDFICILLIYLWWRLTSFFTFPALALKTPPWVLPPHLSALCNNLLSLFCSECGIFMVM